MAYKAALVDWRMAAYIRPAILLVAVAARAAVVVGDVIELQATAITQLTIQHRLPRQITHQADTSLYYILSERTRKISYTYIIKFYFIFIVSIFSPHFICFFFAYTI
jgi:hypothetical protein